MSNPYYVFTPRFIPGTKVRAQAVNTQFDLLEDAFDLLPAVAGSIALGTPTLGVESGSGNAYAVTMPNTRLTNANGDEVVFKATHQNSGASTLQVDSIAAVPLVRWDGTALSSGDILVDSYYVARYDSTNIRFLVVAPAQSTTVGTISYATPSGKAKLTASAGAASTLIRSDADIAIDQTVAPTWTGQHTFSMPVLAPAGGVATPGLAFSTDQNTGLYNPSADILSLVVGGAQTLQATTAQVLLVPASTASAPGYSYFSDPDTGIWNSAANQLAFATGGANRIVLDANGFASTIVFSGPAGSAASPTFSFTGDSNTGAYSVSADTWGVATGGTLRFSVNGSGNGVFTGTVSGTNLSSSGGANPSTSVGLAAVNGSAITFMRSDGAPALSQSITPTWTGAHAFTATGRPAAIALNAATPIFSMKATGAAADAGTWEVLLSATQWQLHTLNDAASVANDVIIATRSGASLTDVSLGNTTNNNTFKFLGTGSITAAGVYLGPTGSAGAPAFSFSGDSNTGAYNVGADDWGVATGGTLRFDISSTAITSTIPYRAADGSVGAPTYAFSGDTDTGIFRQGADDMRLVVGGTAQLLIRTDAVYSRAVNYGIDGAIGAPAYSFENDPNTGIYRPSADTMNLVAGGNIVFRVTTASIDCLNQLSLSVNSVGSATTGAATALPANPVGYFAITINGTQRRVAYYGD